MINSLHIQIIKKFKLDYYLKIILTKNNGNKNPYHNFYHLLTVMKNCYKISIDEQFDDLKSIRLILIAALFHDFNHFGKKIDDSKNIKEAITGFLNFSKENNEDNQKIIEIINATEYPYKISSDKLTLQQKVIRDADAMQFYCDNYIQQVIFGLLMEELSMTLSEALDTQFKFFNEVKPLTKFAKYTYDKWIQSRIDDTNYLYKLIK